LINRSISKTISNTVKPYFSSCYNMSKIVRLSYKKLSYYFIPSSVYSRQTLIVLCNFRYNFKFAAIHFPLLTNHY
jgi:hypothetical protein